MKLIVQKSTKLDKYDNLRFIREDASVSECAMPRQGILPHDLIHYIVETSLPFTFGFLNQVALGADPTFVMEAVHDKSNLQVEVEAIQVEAIVEALQTQLWGGSFEKDMFIYAAEMACSARNTRPYTFGAIDLKAVLFDRALALATKWEKLNYAESMELLFAPASA